ncbi:MAG: hypothetical protein Q4F79_12760 [Eubacteriales bacterium]|nr:hypothetical protein [Eubacteriales bacterium]
MNSENSNNIKKLSKEEQNMEIGWNEILDIDRSLSTLLTEGDYTFRVISFERGRFLGSAKIPACNRAELILRVDTADNRTTNIKCNLLLYRPLEWKISSFFRSIIAKKDGESYGMDWSKVVGAVGRAHIKPRTYINRNGEERQTNNIDYFIDYDPSFFEKEEFTEIDDCDDVPY